MIGWNEGVTNAISYIEENLDKELDIKDIADKAYVSAFYFQKIFHVLCEFTVTSEQYKLLMEPKPRGKKMAGKKEADMSGLPVNRVNHYMTEEELIAEFGENGWKQLPDAISKRYKFIPAKVIVTEHHVGVYASKKDNRIVKADHPKALLKGSPVSASIAAAIMNGKYVNAFPLYRLEKEFERYGLAITRQNMANWMIRLGETYISVMYVAYTK